MIPTNMDIVLIQAAECVHFLDGHRGCETVNVP